MRRCSHGLTKAVYAAAIFMLWLSVTALVLEVAVNIRWAYVLHNNPYILSSLQGTLTPASPGLTPRRDLQGWIQPKPSVHALPAGITPENLCKTDAASIQARRKTFADLSESDRAWSARAYSELVILSDARMRVRGLYGPFGLQRCINDYGERFWQAIRKSQPSGAWQALQQASHAPGGIDPPQSVSLVLPLNLPPFPVPVEIRAFPLANETGWAAFAQFSIPQLQALLKDYPFPGLDPNTSEWDVPWMRYKPNRTEPIQTNAQGFYDDPVAIPKPSDVFRIVCIGGSTTQEGADIRSTYPNFLERSLSALIPDKRIEVVNAGTPGIDTNGHLARICEYLVLDPDLVIFYEGINDIFGILRDVSEPGKTFFRLVAPYSKAIRDYLPRATHLSLHHAPAILRQSALANLGVMGDIFNSQGVPVLMCSVAAPDYAVLGRQERLYFDYDAHAHWDAPLLDARTYCDYVHAYNALLLQACRKNGWGYVPVAENYVGAGLNAFRDLCHMHPGAIENKAGILSEYLRKTPELFANHSARRE